MRSIYVVGFMVALAAWNAPSPVHASSFAPPNSGQDAETGQDADQAERKAIVASFPMIPSDPPPAPNYSQPPISRIPPHRPVPSPPSTPGATGKSEELASQSNVKNKGASSLIQRKRAFSSPATPGSLHRPRFDYPLPSTSSSAGMSAMLVLQSPPTYPPPPTPGASDTDDGSASQSEVNEKDAPSSPSGTGAEVDSNFWRDFDIEAMLAFFDNTDTDKVPASQSNVNEDGAPSSSSDTATKGAPGSLHFPVPSLPSSPQNQPDEGSLSSVSSFIPTRSPPPTPIADASAWYKLFPKDASGMGKKQFSWNNGNKEGASSSSSDTGTNDALSRTLSRFLPLTRARPANTCRQLPSSLSVPNLNPDLESTGESKKGASRSDVGKKNAPPPNPRQLSFSPLSTPLSRPKFPHSQSTNSLPLAFNDTGKTMAPSPLSAVNTGNAPSSSSSAGQQFRAWNQRMNRSLADLVKPRDWQAPWGKGKSDKSGP